MFAGFFVISCASTAAYVKEDGFSDPFKDLWKSSLPNQVTDEEMELSTFKDLALARLWSVEPLLLRQMFLTVTTSLASFGLIALAFFCRATRSI